MVRSNNDEEKSVRSSLSEQRQLLVDQYLKSLNENQIPWSMGWKAIGSPQNANTGKKYRGSNALFLTLIAESRGYKDPRWITGKGVFNNGWKLNEGEKGNTVPVEKWKYLLRYFDKANDKYISEKQYQYLIASSDRQPSEFIKKGFYVLDHTWHVYNVEQCSQILCIDKDDPTKKYPLNEFNKLKEEGKIKNPENFEWKTEPIPPIENDFKEINANDLVNELISKMGVRYKEGGDRAFYSPMRDCITLPHKETFVSDYEYNATKLHEACHSTGHPLRLNRNLSGEYGSESYAKEELRAEIGSSFLMQRFNMEQSQYNIENHKAYIQGWISILKKDPQELFKAITDADKIVQYVEDILWLDKTIEKMDPVTDWKDLQIGDKITLLFDDFDNPHQKPQEYTVIQIKDDDVLATGNGMKISVSDINKENIVSMERPVFAKQEQEESQTKSFSKYKSKAKNQSKTGRQKRTVTKENKQPELAV